MLGNAQKQRVLQGMSYDEYTAYTARLIETYKTGSNPKYEILKLNFARSRRIDKTFVPSGDLASVMEEIQRKQIWLIISEPWCGDSAQNIPYFVSAALINPMVELKILLRDTHPDIMDLYLTNGTRSIPMVIIFDEEFNELGRWGSRPASARELVLNLKNQNLSKPEINENLHSWYAQNKGADVTREICELLRNVLTPEIL